MTHMEIINRALVAVGSNPKPDMEETKSNEVSSIMAYYEACWREVLSAHPWSDLQQEETLTGTEDGIMNRFQIPDDCIRISSMTDGYGTQLQDVARRGRYLYAKSEQISLTYVSTQDILPVDWSFVNSEIQTMLPPAVDDIVSLRLASQIVFRISQNQELQIHLHNRYIAALQNAKMNDMQGYGGQDPWGSVGGYDL